MTTHELPDSALAIDEHSGRTREAISVCDRDDDFFDRPSSREQLSPLYSVVYDSQTVEPLVLTITSTWVSLPTGTRWVVLMLNDADLGGLWAGPGVNRWLRDSEWNELGFSSAVFATKEEADRRARDLALADLRPRLDWFRDSEDDEVSPESIAARLAT